MATMQQLLQQWPPPNAAGGRRSNEAMGDRPPAGLRPRDQQHLWQHQQPPQPLHYREHDRLYTGHTAPAVPWAQQQQQQQRYDRALVGPTAGMPSPMSLRAEVIPSSTRRRNSSSSSGSPYVYSPLACARGREPELPHPLWQDRSLSRDSSRQFRTKEQEGRVFTSHLHPPLKPFEASFLDPRSAPTSASGTARDGMARSMTSSSASASSHHAPPKKRYHAPLKAPLPALNHATFQRYLATTQPLLHPSINPRRMCTDNQWREALLQRKVDPYARDVHA
jgi:hypothetical protein